MFWDPRLRYCAPSVIHHARIASGQPSRRGGRAGPRVSVLVTTSTTTAFSIRGLVITLLACPLVIPLVLCLTMPRQQTSKVRAVFLALAFGPRRDGRCLGSDVTQTLHKPQVDKTRLVAPA